MAPYIHWVVHECTSGFRLVVKTNRNNRSQSGSDPRSGHAHSGCQSPIWIWLVNYLHLHLHLLLQLQQRRSRLAHLAPGRHTTPTLPGRLACTCADASLACVSVKYVKSDMELTVDSFLETTHPIFFLPAVIAQWLAFIYQWGFY